MKVQIEFVMENLRCRYLIEETMYVDSYEQSGQREKRREEWRERERERERERQRARQKREAIYYMWVDLLHVGLSASGTQAHLPCITLEAYVSMAELSPNPHAKT